MIDERIRDRQRRNGSPLIGRSPPFIFIHIPKAAGSSIRRAFKPYLRDWNPARRMVEKLRTPRTSDGLRADGLHAHSRALDYKSALGQDFARYFVFTFVRNPFDRHVSNYHYIRQQPDHPLHDRLTALDFEGYMEIACRHPRLQTDYLVDEDGTLLVDYIGRVETMEDSLGALNQRLGTNAQVVHANRSSHRDTASYFSPRAVDMVVAAFARDFETLGYDTALPEPARP